jgi:hypothetical protein
VFLGRGVTRHHVGLRHVPHRAATGKSVSGGWLGLPDQPRRPLNARPRSVNVGRIEIFRIVVRPI